MRRRRLFLGAVRDTVVGCPWVARTSFSQTHRMRVSILRVQKIVWWMCRCWEVSGGQSTVVWEFCRCGEVHATFRRNPSSGALLCSTWPTKVKQKAHVRFKVYTPGRPSDFKLPPLTFSW